jgi:hypothetical protein
VAQRLRTETRNADPQKPGKAPDGSSRGAPHDFRERAARLSSIQSEMREAVRRLGLPEEGALYQQVTVIAIAPWLQVLVQSRRLLRLTIEEAEEIGRAVTASLLTVAKKGIKP